MFKWNPAAQMSSALRNIVKTKSGAEIERRAGNGDDSVQMTFGFRELRRRLEVRCSSGWSEREVKIFTTILSSKNRSQERLYC